MLPRLRIIDPPRCPCTKYSASTRMEEGQNSCLHAFHGLHPIRGTSLYDSWTEGETGQEIPKHYQWVMASVGMNRCMFTESAVRIPFKFIRFSDNFQLRYLQRSLEMKHAEEGGALDFSKGSPLIQCCSSAQTVPRTATGHVPMAMRPANSEGRSSSSSDSLSFRTVRIRPVGIKSWYMDWATRS